MHATEVPAHVYARIAEHVSKLMGVDVSVDEISSVLGGCNPDTIADRTVIELIMDEGKEYGIA